MTLWAVLAALLVSALGTGLVRWLALRHGMLDVPNQRSMHVRATPSGGGLAILAAFLVGVAVLKSGGVEDWSIAWLAGAMAIGAVGYLDDRSGLSAGFRLIVHGVAAAALVASEPLRSLTMPGGPVVLGAAGMVVAWLATMWSTNLFNFMDGIDGIAAMQAIFVFTAAALLAIAAGQPPGSVAWLGVVAAAALGFLPWNWQPARIFMGDTGSGVLGYLVAVGALSTAGRGYISVWTWIILHGVFIADSTVTLFMRMSRGEEIFTAHRSHLYQRLAQRYASHRAITSVFASTNVLWLLPCAAAAVAWPEWAAVITGVALLPLMMCVYVLGGGRPQL